MKKSVMSAKQLSQYIQMFKEILKAGVYPSNMRKELEKHGVVFNDYTGLPHFYQ